MIYCEINPHWPGLWMMTAQESLVLAGAVYNWGEEVDALSQSFEGDKFAPGAITEKEQKALTTKSGKMLHQPGLMRIFQSGSIIP